MTPSLEGWSTKAKEAPSPHEVRLARLDTNPVFQNLGDGPTPWGRPKLRWKDVVIADLRKKQLNIALASGRGKWRNSIRSVTQQNVLQPTMSGKRRGNYQ